MQAIQNREKTEFWSETTIEEEIVDKNREMQFTNFLFAKAKEAERTIDYRPTYFLNMLGAEGGYQTARKLLIANKISDGFIKLSMHNRLDLSVEALVVESEWRQYFDPILLSLAEKRLKQAKYPFTRWNGGEDDAKENVSLAENTAKSVRKTGQNRIVIKWPGGDEYIDTDLDELGEDTEIYLTRQTYEDSSTPDIYSVSSTVRALGDDRYEIKISYDSTMNPGIADSWWGTTCIVMHKGDASGVAVWSDKHDASRNGDFDFETVYARDAEDSQRWAAEDRALSKRPDLEETVIRVLRDERRGQHVFRERVLQFEPACRLTGVTDPAHLRASHIKPWAESDHHERLDGNNGLMLAPHVDHLFDRAYISFEDDGTLLVLNDDIEQLLRRWGINTDENPPPQRRFKPQQCAYLAHHRNRFESVRQRQ